MERSYLNPLEVGDLIHVVNIVYTTIQGYRHEAEEFRDCNAVVTSVTEHYAWIRRVDIPATGRIHRHSSDSSSISILKRNTSILPGVDYMLFDQEWDQIDTAITEWYALRFDDSYQGFCNPATYLAHLYLNNESTFHRMLPSLWRKDGTINPEKVKKAFKTLKLKIDEWAYECRFTAPIFQKEKFELFSKRVALRLGQVDWNEVAAQFKRK